METIRVENQTLGSIKEYIQTLFDPLPIKSRPTQLNKQAGEADVQATESLEIFHEVNDNNLHARKRT